MKSVLIVDASPIFREFLKDKLAEEKIQVSFSQEQRDAITKIINLLPDLVILNIDEMYDEAALMDFLQKKDSDPNASRIPMVAVGPSIDRSQIAVFAQYGIIKYFAKPVKFDIFFESIGRILKVAFSMDITPCVLDLHKNNDIIFVEVAQGLNREKLFLLKYKISEMIDHNEIEAPKVILMLTNLELTFVDGLNLELLLDNILAHPKVHTKNVKILSFSSFVKELIDGHQKYNGIEITTDLSRVLNSIVDSTITSSVSDLITDKILQQKGTQTEGSIEMRFYSDTGVPDDTPTDEHEPAKIAIVDDDIVILNLLKGTFEAAGATCDTFLSGTEFLTGVNKYKYDLIILDILMPGISGFDTLRRLQVLPNIAPIIVYSQAVQKEMAVQALSLGAKSYLIKPQKPEVIIQKAKELLNGKL